MKNGLGRAVAILDKLLAGATRQRTLGPEDDKGAPAGSRQRISGVLVAHQPAERVRFFRREAAGFGGN